MAKKKVNPTVTQKKHYQNPAEKWWGKLVVWLIIVGMVGGIVFGFVLSIINGNG